MALNDKLKSEVEDKLKKLIVEQLKGLDVKYDSIRLDSTWDNLNADYIDLTELRMAVEETYKIDISDEDVQGILTVGQAVDYISNQIRGLSKKPGPWQDFVNRIG